MVEARLLVGARLLVEARPLVAFFRSRSYRCVASAIERDCRSRIGTHVARLGSLALKARLPVAVAP